MQAYKANLDFQEKLEELLDMGYQDHNPRPKWKDGTPAHTLYLTDVKDKYDVSKGESPFSTLRDVAIKTGLREIFWIYQHASNELKVAHELGIRWWDEWEVADTTIGQRYGHTVNRYNIIQNLLKELEQNPFSRRHIIDLWQYQEFFEETQGLNPCMYNTTFMVRLVGDVYYLDVMMKQRSQDFLMANTVNRSQYLGLALMICSHLRFHTDNHWEIGTFSHQIDNLHIYDRHLDAANELIKRDAGETGYQEQIFQLPVDKDFYDITLDDFVIDLKTGPKLKEKLEIAI